MNNVGAIASAETRQRYVQFQINKTHKEGILSQVDVNQFTFVSVDNIDLLQRRVFVTVEIRVAAGTELPYKLLFFRNIQVTKLNCLDTAQVTAIQCPLVMDYHLHHLMLVHHLFFCHLPLVVDYHLHHLMLVHHLLFRHLPYWVRGRPIQLPSVLLLVQKGLVIE